MFPALAAVPAILIVALAASLVGRWRERARRRRALSRLPPRADATSLVAHAGKRVALEGELLESSVETVFPGAARALEEPHVRAVTRSTDPLRMRVGDHVVLLRPPVQVVLGAKEGAANVDGDLASRRSLRPGDRLCAVGRLVAIAGQEAQGGYRDSTVAYELRPEPEVGWEASPIALYATRGGPTVLGTVTRLAVMLVSFGAIAAGMFILMTPHPDPRASVFARPACFIPLQPPWTLFGGVSAIRGDHGAADGRALRSAFHRPRR